MKKNAASIMCAAFLLLIVGAPMLWLARSGAEVAGLLSTAENQEEENRTLAEFPHPKQLEDWLELPEEFDLWFSDHLFLKTYFVRGKAETERILFGELDSEKVILGTQKPWLFHRSDDGQPLETFKKTNYFTETELFEIRENLDALQQDLNDCGIRLILFISPDKEQIYGEDYMPDKIRVMEGEGRTWQLIQYLEETSKLPVVYPQEALLEAKREAQTQGVEALYYVSDTHWNEAGAWIGADALLKKIGCQMGEAYEGRLPSFENGPSFRGDLQKLSGLGREYDSHMYIPPPSQIQTLETIRDRNDEVIWEKSRSTSDQALPVSVYLAGDSFRWNLAGYIQEGVSDAVISSRYYLDPELLLEAEPDVFVYMIAERYLHELSIIPGINTAPLPMP